jgi:7,8-dihydropterin-6-yl-methyl-4-(beta-D-ribofuranosyl)aminobenzene 5'-phosphate synthase
MKRLLMVLLVTAVILTVGCFKNTPEQETPNQIIDDITAQDAFVLIQENQGNPDFVILDVRPHEEFAQGHIENALNLDYKSETFSDELNNLDKDKTYLVYCADGERSASALAIMGKLGFIEAYNMLDGISQWQKDGLPITAAVCAQPEPLNQPSPGQSSTEITIVYDNNPFDSRLKTAWGFSCLVRLPEKTILFDTGGNSAILLDNMLKLQIDPQEVEMVVLSHIHNDHVGGLGGFLEQNNDVTVYLPRSFPQEFKDDVTYHGAKVEEIHEARELLPGVYSTGELGGVVKEQSLIITTSQGLVIITGCAHPGVVNIVKKAKEIVPDSPVYLVLGGFHLSEASPRELESIIDSFRQLGVENVAPCHCSGDQTRQLFKERYGTNYIESGVGKIISLPF